MISQSVYDLGFWKSLDNFGKWISTQIYVGHRGFTEKYRSNCGCNYLVDLFSSSAFVTGMTGLYNVATMPEAVGRELAPT
jgi:hypothetical protein